MEGDLPKLNLDNYSSPDEAIEKVEELLNEPFLEISKKFPFDRFESNHQVLFRFFLSRFFGVHGGIARELKHSNPHSVFPLLRVYFETLVSLIYSIKNPAYIDALVEFDPNPKNPILIAEELFRRLEDESKTLRLIYHDLSRVTHPKADAVFSVFPPLRELDDGRKIMSWSLHPFWRDDNDFMGSCAAIVEMAETAIIYLEEFGQRHLIGQPN